MVSRTLEVEVDDRVYRVTVRRDMAVPERLRVAWNDRERLVDVHQLDAQSFSLVEIGPGSKSHDVRVVETGRPGTLDVHVGAATVRTVVDRRRSFFGDNGAGGGEGSGEVVAPMPGKVVRLLVQEGDAVSEGQCVAVVEAMKMENELAAKCAGRVTRTSVGVGESVETGKVLVVIERTSPSKR